jgi:hypothetical protein
MAFLLPAGGFPVARYGQVGAINAEPAIPVGTARPGETFRLPGDARFRARRNVAIDPKETFVEVR